jgi:HK97 family phage major capsid protein
VKLTRATLTWGLLALIAMAAFCTLAGHPLIPPEALAGMGMLPLAIGETDDIAEVLGKMAKGLEDFKARQRDEVSELRRSIDQLTTRGARPGIGASNILETPDTLDRKQMDMGYRALMAGDKSRAQSIFEEAKAMSAGTGPDGGFLVDTMFSRTFNKVLADVSPIYRLARKIPLDAGTDTFEEPIDKDQATAVWAGEAQPRPETGTPKVLVFSASVNELYAMPKVTQTLIDLSSFDVVGWLASKVGDAFGATESAAFHVGDGTAKPRGILAYPTSTAEDKTRPWGTVQHILADVPPEQSSILGQHQYDTFINMTVALRSPYRAGAVWLMNRKTAGMLRLFKDNEYRYLWQDSIVAGQPSTFLGYPVQEDEDMPDAAPGNFPIAFGNFSKAYTVVEKPGFKFLPDPYTAKPHVLLYSYRRVGGGVHNTEAYKLLKMQST